MKVVTFFQEQGVTEENVVWVCSDASSPGYFWQIFIYTYLVMLQIVGIVLAFQTRKVKLPGLRDSKFIASIVYISSIILVILALVTFGLRTYINIGTGILVAGIITLTTITLGLIFIPKVHACFMWNGTRGYVIWRVRISTELVLTGQDA
jgi:gamma-aminobutyric acid type B receptor